MAIKISNQDIMGYYNENQVLYSLFWSENALHYGFWEKNTKKLSEAVLNTNRFVLDCLKINSRDSVLDAGCGVGGTCIYIAEKSGAKVTGITLSDVQLRLAKTRAAKTRASKLVNFSKQDFTKTNFRDESFSKIYGIESICHANNKIDFLREAYRILKKGGKIAIIDGFLQRKNLNNKEKEVYSKWLVGWAVPNLATRESFQCDLKKAGFKKIRYCGMQDKIKKSRDRLFRLALIIYPFSWIFFKLGIFSSKIHNNTLAAIYQRKLLSESRSIATYGVFVAEK